MTEIPEWLRRKLNEPPPPALEQVRSFLRGYIACGASPDEVREELVRPSGLFHGRTLRRRLQAFEEVLSTEYPEGTLAMLVAWDANVALDDPSDEASAQWLRELADLIRQVIPQVPGGAGVAETASEETAVENLHGVDAAKPNNVAKRWAEHVEKSPNDPR